MPVGLNPLGEVGDGSLIFRGPVMDAELHARGDGKPVLRTQGSEPSIEVFVDSMLVEDSINFQGRKERTVRRARPGEGKKDQMFKAPVKCLGVRSSRDDSISGLVLGLSPRKEGYFERVGYVVCGGETFRRKRFQTIKLA